VSIDPVTAASPITGAIRTAPPPAGQERDDLAAAVRSVLTRFAPIPEGVDDAPGGYDAGLWQRLAALGLPGLAVPEHLGGSGGNYLDAHAVLVELGRSVVATPYPATLLATQTALLTGPEPALPTGLPVDPGRVGAPGSATVIDGLVATRGRDGWTLNGRAGHVLDGARSELVLAVAGTEAGPVLFALEPAGLSRQVRPTMDRTLHLACVTATGTPGRELGPLPWPAVHRLADLRTIMLTADQIGGARRCLELLVEYLGRRIQFGRPVGSFQAVKHRLADLLVLVESAESASWAAAAAWAADAPDTPLLAVVAGSYCGETYLKVAAEMVQLHGGIAITWEHPAHRYFKHAHTTATLFGTPADHRGRLADRLRDGGRRPLDPKTEI